MGILFVGYKNCSTSMKAEAWLTERGIRYDFRDIKSQNPTEEELREWFKMSGFPLKRLFNTSGLIYKEMKLSEKLPTMSEDEQLKLLSTSGMLVKRPVIVGDGFALFGFKEKEWEEILL